MRDLFEYPWAVGAAVAVVFTLAVLGGWPLWLLIAALLAVTVPFAAT
jgi:hypothetical protein